MHIGGVLLFDGPAPRFETVLNHIRRRLHLVPRYRQKLATPPLDSGRPLWVDDPNFNLEYHVRNTALPAPGSERQLLELVGRLASQRLDRTKPLWELWLVEGIEPVEDGGLERFALISKAHHALVDGVAGVDLAAVLLDFSPTAAPPSTEGLLPWVASPEPSALQLAAAGARGAVRSSAELAVQGLRALARPTRTGARLRDATEGLGELLWAALNPAPRTPLNVPIGPHRRFVLVRQQLADYRAVKNRFHTTVNDVVLAVVAGALGRWLRSRGVATDGVEMRALVPVSVRSEEEHGTLGNRLVALRGPLPVYIRDPVMRLSAVSAEMNALKRSKQAVGAATLVALNERLPPTVLAQASRIQFSTRLFNLLVTNIPGPQVPLYLMGSELRDMFPLAFLPDNNALAVAIMSYNGRIEYGLLGDLDALPDIEVLARGIEQSLAELMAVTQRQPAGATPSAQRRGGPGSEMRATRQRGRGTSGRGTSD